MMYKYISYMNMTGFGKDIRQSTHLVRPWSFLVRDTSFFTHSGDNGDN
jgi:hypothetical protein